MLYSRAALCRMSALEEVATAHTRHVMGTRQHPFDQLMELDTAHIKLDCAALLIARDEYPHIDVPTYLSMLDNLADEVADERPGLSAPRRYEALRAVLIDHHDFGGDVATFFKPEHSYLNRLLDERVGAPMALLILWLEVARRLKWPMAAVGFPGHHLVRFDDPERCVIADPFEDCSLSMGDCRQLLRRRLGRAAKMKRAYLSPIDTRAVLARVLDDMRTIYTVRGDWTRLATILRRLSAVEPGNGKHLCELAALHCHLGNMRHAYAHLACYLERMPDGHESALVRSSLRRIEAAISALN